jgi:hypothetical protein
MLLRKPVQRDLKPKLTLHRSSILGADPKTLEILAKYSHLSISKFGLCAIQDEKVSDRFEDDAVEERIEDDQV